MKVGRKEGAWFYVGSTLLITAEPLAVVQASFGRIAGIAYCNAKTRIDRNEGDRQRSGIDLRV